MLKCIVFFGILLSAALFWLAVCNIAKESIAEREIEKANEINKKEMLEKQKVQREDFEEWFRSIGGKI